MVLDGGAWAGEDLGGVGACTVGGAGGGGGGGGCWGWPFTTTGAVVLDAWLPPEIAGA